MMKLLGTALYYIILWVVFIVRTIKNLFILEIETFVFDLHLLDSIYQKKKVKLSTIISLVSAIPLLLASVFVAKCSTVQKGNTATQVAIIVCVIMFLKTLFSFLLKKDTYQLIEMTKFKPLPIFLWLYKGVECLLFFCLWQELGLGFLAVYLFGSVVRSNTIWIKHEMISWDKDSDFILKTFRGEIIVGSSVTLVGMVLCAIRFVRQEISALGLICAASYCIIQIVKAYSLFFDKGLYKLYHSEKYQKKEPVFENGARYISASKINVLRKLTIKDVIMTFLPVLLTVGVWISLSRLSINFLSKGASFSLSISVSQPSISLFSDSAAPWNLLILACILIYSFISTGYCGSFKRLASLLVLIPAVILLWSTVGNISILGMLLMLFGKYLFQFDKYQICF